jgi:superfamily I DNA/RNA helicase
MKIHDNLHLILGPPGTGKTTRLIQIVKDYLDIGILPNEIGFVSFTRKAAREAQDRIPNLHKAGQTEVVFPWFRTLHSFAYHTLGLSREECFDSNDCWELGNLVGHKIVMKFTHDSNNVLGEMGGIGSSMMFLEGLSRNICKSLEETWYEFGESYVTWSQLSHFQRTLVAYKKSKGIFDYTDMIQLFIDGSRDVYYPPLKILIVDEAQDLTRLQWKMVKQIAKPVDKVFVAGDDDQAIYEWSGADIQSFLELEYNTKEVLYTSYRLPKTVWEYSNTISSRIEKRYEKDWEPRIKAKGLVKYVHSIEDVPFENGTWLVLVRNRTFIERFAMHCYHLGVPYSTILDTLNPLASGEIQAIQNWEHLRKGKKIKGIHARKIYEFLPLGKGKGVARGFKLLPAIQDNELVDLEHLEKFGGLQTRAIWHEALTRIPLEDREYYIALLRRKEKLTIEPRIHISTIHSVKGGEADNVVVYPELSYKTYKGYFEKPDAEHRVFYVAVTRAKKRLYILSPQNPEFYSL